jgi:hypothetical protein
MMPDIGMSVGQISAPSAAAMPGTVLLWPATRTTRPACALRMRSAMD